MPFAMVVAFVALGFCWAISTPPGGGVDEPSHYVRTIGLSRGNLIGDTVDPERHVEGLSGEALHRVNAEAGAYTLPGTLREPLPCNAFKPTRPFSCAQYPPRPEPAVHISNHARYLPGAYVIPALFSRLGSTTWRALFAARIGFLLQDAALLAIVAVALSRRTQRSGPLPTGAAMVAVLSITPVLAFTAGTLSPSATEILGAAAFTAALFTAAHARSSGWTWCAAVVGVFACWTRDLGVPCVAMAVVAVAVLEPNLRAPREWPRRPDRAPAVVLAIGALGAVVWQVVLKRATPPHWNSLSALWHDLGTIADVATTSIGLVGWLDVKIDRFVELVWLALVLIGFGLAAVRLDRRSRQVLGGLIGAYVVIGVVLANGLEQVAFNVQARFLMPIMAVGVVVIAVRVGGDEHRRRGWIRACLVVAAAGHFSALLLSAHHNANGITGAPMNFAHPIWTPPLGWTAIGVVSVLTCIGIAALPLSAPAAKSVT